MWHANTEHDLKNLGGGVLPTGANEASVNPAHILYWVTIADGPSVLQAVKALHTKHAHHPEFSHAASAPWLDANSDGTPHDALPSHPPSIVPVLPASASHVPPTSLELRNSKPHPNALFCSQHHGWIDISVVIASDMRLSLPSLDNRPLSTPGQLVESTIFKRCPNIGQAPHLEGFVPCVIQHDLMAAYINQEHGSNLSPAGHTKDQLVFNSMEILLRVIERVLWIGDIEGLLIAGEVLANGMIWTNASQLLFEAMGFRLVDHHVTPPSLENTTIEGQGARMKLLRAWVEVGAIAAAYMTQHPNLKATHKNNIEIAPISPETSKRTIAPDPMQILSLLNYARPPKILPPHILGAPASPWSKTYSGTTFAPVMSTNISAVSPSTQAAPPPTPKAQRRTDDSCSVSSTSTIRPHISSGKSKANRTSVSFERSGSLPIELSGESYLSSKQPITQPTGNGADAFELPAPSMSSSDARRLIDKSVKVCLKTGNVDRSMAILNGLSNEHKCVFIQRSVSAAIKGGAQSVSFFERLFSDARIRRICAAQTIERGFLPAVESIDNKSIDIPRAYEWLARLMFFAGLSKSKIESIGEKIVAAGGPRLSPKQLLMYEFEKMLT